MHSPSEFVETLASELSSVLVEKSINSISEDIDLTSPHVIGEIDNAIDRLTSLRDVAYTIQRNSSDVLSHLDELWRAVQESNPNYTLRPLIESMLRRY